MLKGSELKRTEKLLSDQDGENTQRMETQSKGLQDMSPKHDSIYNSVHKIKDATTSSRVIGSKMVSVSRKSDINKTLQNNSQIETTKDWTAEKLKHMQPSTQIVIKGQVNLREPSENKTIETYIPLHIRQ
jgi:hypothetical protein